MVKIENIEELKKIKESDYGFVVIITNNESLIHTSNCSVIAEDDFPKDDSDTKYHWFSTYFLAEKKFSTIKPCNLCNP